MNNKGYSNDLLDFLRGIVPWQERWKMRYKEWNDTKTKHGWKLKHPEVGGIYRLDYHSSMGLTPNKPDWLGTYIRITKKERVVNSRGQELASARRKSYITHYYYKNLTKGNSGYFESVSLFAGCCTKVTEMEYLLYAAVEEKL